MQLYQDVEHVARQDAPVRRDAPSAPRGARLPIGEMIEAARVRAWLTTAQVAAQTKLRADALRRYEAGKCDPDVCAVHILRHVLGGLDE